MQQVRYLLVDEGRAIVTITGTGGIGKTRFACEVARWLLPHFPGGAYLIELKEQKAVEGICVAVADAFNLRLDQAGDAIRVIGSFLKTLSRPTLLVFDNFEHLAVHADRTVRAWRSTARAIQVLVTSRVSLGITGEYLFPLPSLDLPSYADVDRKDIETLNRNESVQLFCQTASARGRRFALTAETAWPVTEVCRLLQGQPLPIILVAKRARFRPILELVSELTTRPLAATYADGQTLRETIAWSYDLLSEVERDVFRQICVFRDGFTMEAVEKVVMVPPGAGRPAQAHVERLCDFSLVECVSLPDGRVRFALFQTVMDFGRELWPDGPDRAPFDLADRWAKYFMDYAEEWSTRVYGEDCNTALNRMTDERENILAAHHWAIQGGSAVLASRLILAHAPALRFRGPWQIRVGRFEETLAALAETEPRLAVLLQVELSDALWGVSEYQAAFEVSARALAIARGLPAHDAIVLARALDEAAKRANDVGNNNLALSYHNEGMTLGIRETDDRVVALHETGIGSLLDRFGRFSEAQSYVQSAVKRLERIGDRLTLAWAVNRLGLVLWHEGRIEEAIDHFQRVERLFREADYPRWYAGAMTNQGLALNDLERFEEAELCFKDAAVVHIGQGNRSWWAVNQGGLGANYLLRGRPGDAIPVLSGALLAAQEAGYKENQALIHGLIGRAHAALGAYREARVHHVRAVVIENRIGTRDRRYFGNLVNLASTLKELGQLRKARSLLGPAREVAERLNLSTTHPVRLVRDDLALAETLKRILS